jgi:hypothetical protein
VWLTWISVQSIRQALLLKRLSRGSLEHASDDAVAIHGQVVVTGPLERPPFGSVLWYHSKTQELRGYGRNRTWRTIEKIEEAAGFGIRTGGQVIWIEGSPTEVQGTRRRTDYGEGSGCMGLLTLGGGFFGSGAMRTITRWLPVVESATLIGHLVRKGSQLELGKDRRLGLLLSPYSPKRAMWTEAIKGTLGLAAVVAAVSIAVIFLNR